MLDYRMDTFITVCKYMNFTRASEELHLAQSTVSLHIHALEEHYGVKLFTLLGKRIELTEEGKMILNLAITQKHDEQKLRDKICAKGGLHIRLGATLSVAENLITQPLAQFLKRHLSDCIQIDIDNTDHLLEKIRASALDAAFIEGGFPIQEFSAISYRKEPFIAVCAPYYEQNNTWKTVKDLCSSTLLIREQGSGSREILETFLTSHWCALQDFHRIIEIASIHLIIEMVKSGIGVTFLYESAVKTELENGTLCKIPIPDCTFNHEISYLWKKGSLYENEYRNILQEFQ